MLRMDTRPLIDSSAMHANGIVDEALHTSECVSDTNGWLGLSTVYIY
jgi:hypothetical protein